MSVRVVATVQQVWARPEGGRERVAGWMVGALVVSVGPLGRG